MITQENVMIGKTEKENFKQESNKRKEVVVDTNILLACAGKIMKKDEDFKMLKPALELVIGEKIEKIYITSPVYAEIEGKKKSGDKYAQIVYSWLGKILYDNEVEYKYVELPKHPDGADDAIIEFAIEKEAIFISLDIRSNIRYFNKANIKPKMRLDEGKFIKLIEIVILLENLKDDNLYLYLQKAFDAKKTNIVEFIQATPKERLKRILILIVEEWLNGEDENFLEKIKETIIESKTGEISDKLLYKSLNKLKGYNFGDISYEESLLEEYSELIDKFLKEKGFDSFRELQKLHPFQTEEELVKGIIRYYEVK